MVLCDDHRAQFIANNPEKVERVFTLDDQLNVLDGIIIQDGITDAFSMIMTDAFKDAILVLLKHEVFKAEDPHTGNEETMFFGETQIELQEYNPAPMSF